MGGDRIGCGEGGAEPSGYLRPSPSFRQAVVKEGLLLQNYTQYLGILWRSRLLWEGWDISVLLEGGQKPECQLQLVTDLLFELVFVSFCFVF